MSQSTLGIQNVKIGPLADFEKRSEKTILEWPNWFLIPNNWGYMFVLKCGLNFSFRALEVPEPRVWKRPLSLSKA